MAKRKTIWVFFGLIASGKSTMADGWAARQKLSCYNSDRVRKELAGIAATAKQKCSPDQGIYSREFTMRTYDALLKRSEKELERGNSVVLDASYQEREERARLVDLATRLDARIVFVYCICSSDVVKNRLEKRSMDPDAVSDGRWDIYQIQKQRFETPDELGEDILITLATDRPVPELLDQLDTRVEV